MLTSYVRRGCTNTLSFAVTSVTAKGIWLLAMPFIFSRLTVADIGIYDYYQSIFLIGSLMISSLSAQPLSRFYLKYRNEHDRQQASVATSLLIISVCAAFCFLLSIITYARYSICGDCYFVMFLLLNAALFACFSFVTSFYQIREHIKEYMLLYCSQSLLSLLIVFLSLTWGFGVSSLFWANSVSYLLCLPILVLLFTQSGSWSQESLIEQLRFGLPLLAYNILYMLLFAVDRWYLAAQYGYQMSGLYAILWYFGRLFVYGTLALYEASPILLYNAQHEPDGNQIITRTIKFITLIYVTGALMITPCAYVMLTKFMPQHQELLKYVPLFITPLLLVEVGRFWQAGFNLATKTHYIPFISLVTLLIQLGGLYLFGSLGLQGVIYANGLAFLSYALMNAIGSTLTYHHELFDVRQIATLFALFIAFNLFLWYSCTTHLPLVYMCVAALVWLPSLWVFGFFSTEEKRYILQIFKKILPVA